MASFTPRPFLMGLPGEIRHLIMLQLFNERNMIITLDPKTTRKGGDLRFYSWFDTAPVLVCKQMRFDALAAVLMRGIELQVHSLCNMQHVEVLLPAIRQCIRWLKSRYDYDCCGRPRPLKDVWLGPSSLEPLPNVQSIFVHARGELSCEILTVDSEAGLRSKVESQKVVDEIDLYLRDECDLYIGMLSKLNRTIVVHLNLSLCSNWETGHGALPMPDYLSVLASYHNKQKQWSLKEIPDHQTVDFYRGGVTIPKRHKT